MDMKYRRLVWALCGALVVTLGAGLQADTLTIYDVQSNTSDGDASVYDGQTHNVTGGIVTHIWQGWQSRVYLQDPAYSSWGGIVVKDWEGGALANNVNIGDRVDFTDIVIEEFRGTTFLQYNTSWSPTVAFNVVSSGNTVPDPVLLTAADLPVPVDHTASEPYESMAVTMEDLVVGYKDLGKAGDNYELRQDSDLGWGTDYMNVDAGGPYDPRIDSGRVILGITGIVEQYTNDPWDYYQLMTRSESDIVANGSIPTVSAWGMLAMSLLLACAGTVVLRRVRCASV
jgi:hypothetical protein